jgi:hypothetical protein
MAIWYNVWPFAVVCGPLVYFSRFGNLATLFLSRTVEGKTRHEFYRPRLSILPQKSLQN